MVPMEMARSATSKHDGSSSRRLETSFLVRNVHGGDSSGQSISRGQSAHMRAAKHNLSSFRAWPHKAATELGGGHRNKAIIGRDAVDIWQPTCPTLPLAGCAERGAPA